MYRKIMQFLESWKKSAHRKPLILQGARQVGKVDMKTLYPMDMEEFMLAMGEDALAKQIRKCFAADTPYAGRSARCGNAALQAVSCSGRYARVCSPV